MAYVVKEERSGVLYGIRWSWTDTRADDGVYARRPVWRTRWHWLNIVIPLAGCQGRVRRARRASVPVGGAASDDTIPTHRSRWSLGQTALAKVFLDGSRRRLRLLRHGRRESLPDRSRCLPAELVGYLDFTELLAEGV